MTAKGWGRGWNRCAVVVLGLLTVGVPAGAAELRMGFGGVITSADPHLDNLRANNALAAHLFDGLVGRDATLRPVPALAESWRALDSRRWEFRLRPGVRFHDGAAFSARDVVYSLCRVSKVTGSHAPFGGFLKGVASVVAPDPRTLVIATTAPDPMLPRSLSPIAILPAPPGTEPVFDPAGCPGGDWPNSEDFDRGRRAVGTGPFRLDTFDRNGVTRLIRNEDYWGEKPAWDRVSIRSYTDEGARTRALVAGEIDLLDRVAVESLEFLRSWPKVSLVQGTSATLYYLQVDHAREPTPGVHGAGGRNPFRDVRVRKAVSLAIGRAALNRRLLEGLGTPTGQIVPEGLDGHDPGIAVPPFDPVAARRLLAEAGYSDGFEVVLAAPWPRRHLAEAIAQMLGAVGIRVTVEAPNGAAYWERRADFQFSMFLSGWTTVTGDLAYPLRDLLAGRDEPAGLGSANFGHYANPALDARLKQALATLDDAGRDALLRQAAGMVAEDHALIPLFFDPILWAVRSGITFTPRMDFFTLARNARPQD